MTVNTQNAQYISTFDGISQLNVATTSLSIPAQALSTGTNSYQTSSLNLGVVGFADTYFNLSGLETVWRPSTMLQGLGAVQLFFNSSNTWLPQRQSGSAAFYAVTISPSYTGTTLKMNVQFTHGGSAGTINIPAITFNANAYVFTGPF